MSTSNISADFLARMEETILFMEMQGHESELENRLQKEIERKQAELKSEAENKAKEISNSQSSILQIIQDAMDNLIKLGDSDNEQIKNLEAALMSAKNGNTKLQELVVAAHKQLNGIREENATLTNRLSSLHLKTLSSQTIGKPYSDFGTAFSSIASSKGIKR